MENFKHDRYELKELLGKGSYGEVFRAYDKISKTEVAIKCIRRDTQSRSSKYSEMEIMEMLRKQNRGLQKRIVRMYDTMIVGNYDYIVFELLYCNLIQATQNHFPCGYHLKLFVSIGYQLCKALCQTQGVRLKKIGKTSLIHSDLKLDNVMFTDDAFSTIKIVDFGLSFFQFEGNFYLKQNRNYKAPEAIFLTQTEMTSAADMWSVGVILFSLFSNKNMFKTNSIEEQLVNLVNAFGEPSLEMMEGDKMLNLLFDKSGNILKLKSDLYRYASDYRSFKEMFDEAIDKAFGRDMNYMLWKDELYDLFIKIFQLDPKKRITPREALRLPIFALAKKKNVLQIIRDKFKK